jgi:hypothetical protein
VWPKIISLGVVKEEGRRGKAKLYKFNEESPLAKTLVKMTLEFALARVEQRKGLAAVAPVPKGPQASASAS